MMDALERLADAVPPKVREVCATLAAAGHQAVIVGGCVRDVIMGRTPGDWDVASSAHPEDVIRLFKRTVPQGLQHGTVKVLMGKGKENEVEITAFRGEGAYSDARRPDSVTFGVPLHEDLARRDLTVNAIAYDPAAHELVDPFEGRKDIEARRLRAVGRAVDRFTEDGLRVMRAVRFAAQLEFDLDPETEAGILPALPSLAKVSRERVCVELRKTLEASEPSRGLRPANRTGILANILPDVAASIADVESWLARIDRAAPDVRLAAMFLPLADPKRAADLLRALTFSNAEISLVQQLLAVAATDRTGEPAAEAVRRLLSRVDKQKREQVVALWASDAFVNPQLIAVAGTILSAQHPLAICDLAVTGNDLMTALSIKQGPVLGKLLSTLLEYVLVDPAQNTREQLIAEAKRVTPEAGVEDGAKAKG